MSRVHTRTLVWSTLLVWGCGGSPQPDAEQTWDSAVETDAGPTTQSSVGAAVVRHDAAVDGAASKTPDARDAGSTDTDAGRSDAAQDAGQAVATADAGSLRPYKGVANSPCAARTALNVSWYYNWEQSENEACPNGAGGAFVPMIWGHANEQTAQAIASALQSFASKGYRDVLGFNEPDNSTQSNITVDAAIKLWPAFDIKGLNIGSPATQANQTGQTWFKSFVGQLANGKDGRADFLAIHWYGWNAGSCDANASQLESYIRYAEGLPGNRPIWLTEWGCLNQSAPDEATVVSFFEAAAAMLAKHPRVERYAWYPWSTNNNLNDDKGALTALGKVYAALPAYH